MHPHRIIIGRTGTGKSRLAKQIGSRLRLKGETVIAFNPTGEDGYTKEDFFGHIAAEWESWDDKAFCKKLKELTKRKQKVFVIIDEAHEFFTRAGCENLWIGTRGRHFGINIIAITQQGQQINPTFRGQCAEIFLFACSRLDASFMSNEMGSRELENAVSLPVGTCYRLSGSTIEKIKVFEDKEIKHRRVGEEVGEVVG